MGVNAAVAQKEGIEVTVTVDLKGRSVRCTAKGVTITAELVTPMPAITHVGYAVHGAIVDVTPLEIERE